MFSSPSLLPSLAQLPANTAGPPRGSTWVRDIETTNDGVIGYEIVSETRTDVFIGADNDHVKAIKSLHDEFKKDGKTRDKRVGVIRYVIQPPENEDNSLVVAYMERLNGQADGPWNVWPIVRNRF
tara:strand:+ start:3188 stop:3562 length:375 start_codon:yes stop_codon:yes gene_type:complete